MVAALVPCVVVDEVMFVPPTKYCGVNIFGMLIDVAALSVGSYVIGVWGCKRMIDVCVY